MLFSTVTSSIGYNPFYTIKNEIAAGGVFGKSLYHPDELQAKLAQTFSEPDQNKMVAFAQECEKMIIDDYCILIPLYVRTAIAAKSKNLHEVHMYDPWVPSGLQKMHG